MKIKTSKNAAATFWQLLTPGYACLSHDRLSIAQVRFLPRNPSQRNPCQTGLDHNRAVTQHIFQEDLIKMTKDRSCMTCTNGRNLPALRTPFMIGVAGGTASGKSTVCSTLVDKLGQSEVSAV